MVQQAHELEARTRAARFNHPLRRRAGEIELLAWVDKGTAGFLEAWQGFTPVEQSGNVN